MYCPLIVIGSMINDQNWDTDCSPECAWFSEESWSCCMNQPKPKRKQSSRFVKPTLEEIADYIQEKKYNLDAESFYNYYESVGWKIGDKPMKSWKAACLTWVKRNNAQGNQLSVEMQDELDEYERSAVVWNGED